ncbi:MAG TPA: biotin synthase BioB, partial [Candidatus Omnitrophica bacterium]|nr:biotin synthase BioB [Candidatus Omnitrophota bacterium]
MEDIFVKLENKVLSGGLLSFKEADMLYSVGEDNFMQLLTSASRIRQHYREDKISLCSITNARSGKCNEDCVFCSQSARHNTDIDVYPLISEEEMFKRAEAAAGFKTNRFCIVTSGRSVNEVELDSICSALVKIRKKFPNLRLDASLGILSKESALKLKKSGLDRYNHNLETAKSNFAHICTTHTYEDRVRTIRRIKECGIQICCGGIIGLGETEKQRIELAFELCQLDID